MAPKKITASKTLADAELRRLAEAELSGSKKKTVALRTADADTLRLIHELEVHQIELEMQQEELIRSHAEAELARDLYTDLYDFAPVGYFTLTRDGQIQKTNLAGAKLLGVERGKLIERRFGQYVSLESRPIFSAFLEKVFSTGGNHETCEIVLQNDGSAPLWAHIEAATDKRQEACRAIVVDITERKHAEEALRENESRLQSIIDTEPECVKVLDLNGRLLEMNPAGLAMIEADNMDDVIGQEVANLVVPEHRMAFKDLIHSISEGRSGTLIFEIKGLKGTHRWLETHAVPLRDKTGSVKEVLGITLDITERKRAEGQIHRQIQHLRALHTIDSAITSSFDLRMTLGVLLSEVISQLGVDAADVLLLNQPAQVLEYAAARGFHSDALKHSQLRLGEGFAGRAIVERRIIHIPNIMKAGGNLVKSLLLAGESFVTYFGVPLIAKGQVEGVLEIFHRTPLGPDLEWMDFLEALAKQAAIAIDNAQLLQNLQHSNTELIVAYDATLEGWSRAMDLRDKETEGHTKRVTEMALQLAQIMGIQELELINIRRGGMLHDIGKLGVPDSILLKPDELTDEEWEVMRLHPKLAYEMLSPITYLKSALDIPYCHHEKWDGTGYPQGLKDGQIPLAARIFAVVDVWDAITSNRPYRSAWPREQALDYIKDQSGRYFDPQVVEAFLKMKT